MPHERPLDEIRPTQLYLSSAKLAAVVEWFDFGEPNYEALPVFEHNGQWYLADGHTRAFVAHLAGEQTLQVERDDEVREMYDFDVYLDCISWCEQAGVRTISDLRGRILDPETYQKRWVERCQQRSEQPTSSEGTKNRPTGRW